MSRRVDQVRLWFRLNRFWRGARTGNSYRRREMRTPENTGANQIRNRSHYRLPAMVAVAGVSLLVLGFSLPGWGWLAWIGLALFIAAAFTMRITFFGEWIPSLFRPDKTDDLPPPP